MHNEKLKNNPLATKNDAKRALLDLIAPLDKYMATSKYGLKYDSGGAHCKELTREVEALLRPLWGIAPFIAGGARHEMCDVYLEKIKTGVDPKSPSYWGTISNRDQLMVEMASIATGICIAKEYFWDSLTQIEQDQLYNWLDQINNYEMPPTNWLFFRILVNLAFKTCDKIYSQSQIDDDLAALDSYYLTDGWYVDGYPDQVDYYIPFAFHFYGLLYVKIVDNEQDEYVSKFKNRATKFAKSFSHFFTKDGVAIPYGRSLTYRFAQCAFWAALAFADVEVLPWGEVKHLCLSNLRHWFNQTIFSASGELTVGYNYRNLIMAEGYNAYGSPYWALKSFIFLAIDEKHPFWTSEEIVPQTQDHLVIPSMRAIIQKSEDANQIQMFTMGQHCEGHAHVESKYEKFVYSTAFGFSVSKGVLSLAQGAFDNTLAISRDDSAYWQIRYGVKSYDIHQDYLTSVWQPFKGCVIRTYLIPLCPWHVRIHEIITDNEIQLADGGFAFDVAKGFKAQIDGTIAKCENELMISSITSLLGQSDADIVYTEPNTNICFDKAAIPTLKTTVKPGRSLIASAVLGAVGAGCNKHLSAEINLGVQNDAYIIKYKNREITIMRK